ncbi:MAG: tRNA pseudouridine(55) synthase TruB [Treponema sp.]|nr:tRNA pseudouridine(55) synthase TruB [Treponema sp.]MEE3436241.1 tRNA pseudouridine(55) synthase TruB [Treponema sp.]
MSSPSGIILYDKKPGVTSFSALGKIKKTLGTKKVGHTGTLDLFAQGLLVVCVGSLTRLAGLITAFDKEYEAKIIFGEQTDTLDPTGQVVKTAPLPSLAALKKSLKKFTGKLMQRPPEFSAIKIGGKRASDLMRSGNEAALPERPIEVYEAQLLDCELDAAFEGGDANEAAASNDCSLSNERALVKSARVRFLVSKGTYIRSLARDIGLDCASAGRLETLKRTRVGSFNLSDACDEESLTAASLREMDAETARLCGLNAAYLRAGQEENFWNGRPLRFSFFEEPLKEGASAVFSSGKAFMGAVKKEGGRAFYEYVVPKSESSLEAAK